MVGFAALGANASTVGRATCRNGNTDRPESGLSGQTTQAEIDAGLDKVGFNCNIDLVGQFQGEGASWQLTAWKNCAYFDQRLAPGALAHPGVAVLDVSDPTHPKPTTWLSEPAMIDPWESLKVNPKRQLLAGDQRPTAPNFPGTGFAVYDISQDCAHPVLKSSVNFAGSLGHTGQWAPDGNTYYITPLQNSISMEVVDTTDPANPKIIPCGNGTYGCNSANGFFVAPSDIPLPRFHDVEFSKDGNTAYVTMFGTGATGAANGLLILDVSDFQSRKTNPAFRKISTLTWDDGSQGAQNALPILVAGKPYILFSDEGGNGVTSCNQGKSLSGFPRLIDISDPVNPKVASKLQLDVHDATNCTKFSTAQITSGGPGFFGYSCHYCNVDDVDNARLAVCNCFAAGMRIFDISDVANPREVGYYKAAAQGTKLLPGSQYANQGTTGPNFTRNYDWATSKVSFPKDRGASSGDIWTTSQDNGFLVVHYDQGGGGCTSAEGSLGGLLALGMMHLARRRKSCGSQRS